MDEGRRAVHELQAVTDGHAVEQSAVTNPLPGLPGGNKKPPVMDDGVWVAYNDLLQLSKEGATHGV
jgi:hypothetical protein